MERLVYADNLSDKVRTHLYLQKKSGKQNKPGLRSFFVYPNKYIKYLGFFGHPNSNQWQMQNTFCHNIFLIKLGLKKS